MQNLQIMGNEKIKPSKFYRKKNSRSLSPLPILEKGHKKKKKDKNLLERRKHKKYNYEDNFSDAHDELEQRILKWLEDNNILMVLPDEKEHDFIQSNLSSIFQKYEKNSGSSVFNSNSNSSSPNITNNSMSNSPRLKIQNSPLLQKRKDSFSMKDDKKKLISLIRLEKSPEIEENEKNDHWENHKKIEAFYGDEIRVNEIFKKNTH